MSATVNTLRVCEQSDSLCLLQLCVQSWQRQCLSDLILCEVTVNQSHKTNLKILDSSELSPNVNSLDINKNSCRNFDPKLALFSTLGEGVLANASAVRPRATSTTDTEQTTHTH